MDAPSSERRTRRNHGVRTTGLGLVVAVVGAVALAAMPAAHAAPPTRVTSAALAKELERIADSATGADTVTYDDSTATQCRGVLPPAARVDGAAGPAVAPLVYTTNRIVIRSSKTLPTVSQAVTSALRHIDSSARVGTIEPIVLPPLGDVPVTPVLSVPLISPTPVDVVALARHLRLPHHKLTASPDYVLSPSGGPTQWWPDGFPAEIPLAGLTTPRAAGTGSGVTIAVYDTGMANPSTSNNPPNLSRLRPGDVETLDADGDGLVDVYYGGHETAIAGVLRVIAPSATVKAVRITDQQTGVATDVSAARRMATTLRESVSSGAWPDLIVNAFGSHSCLLDPADPLSEMVPLGLQAVAETVDLHDEALMVVSAGNRGTDQRFYPAAFSTTWPSAVLSIGALDTTGDADQNPWTSRSRTGPRATFSNYGAWVTGWAPGEDLPTHHVLGLAFEPLPAPVLDGAALVSGTSFAGPLVAGLIAEQMARTGVDADRAWLDIAGSGVRCSAANGSGVAVALTSLTASAVGAPGAPRSLRDC